jgi:hypothetical protein
MSIQTCVHICTQYPHVLGVSVFFEVLALCWYGHTHLPTVQTWSSGIFGHVHLTYPHVTDQDWSNPEGKGIFRGVAPTQPAFANLHHSLCPVQIKGGSHACMAAYSCTAFCARLCWAVLPYCARDWKPIRSPIIGRCD